MRPFERRLRRTINPVSTGLTGWWLGTRPRQVPPRRVAPPPAAGTTDQGPHTFIGVPSPGHWVAPAAQRPGWDWLPENGALPNLRALPRWVRIWFRTPFIDRYAHAWMWWHGGWAVLVPGDTPPPPDGGVREPRRPSPVDRTGAAQGETEPAAPLLPAGPVSHPS